MSKYEDIKSTQEELVIQLQAQVKNAHAPILRDTAVALGIAMDKLGDLYSLPLRYAQVRPDGTYETLTP